MKESTSKKTKKIIFLLIILLLAIGVVGFLLWKQSTTGGLNISTDNLFPFGNPTNRIDEPINNETTDPISGGIRADDFKALTRNRLRLVAQTEVAGYIPVTSQDYYLTQRSINVYNSSRGKVPTNTLPVLRAPRIRYIEQSNAHVSESSLGGTVQNLKISDTDIPNIWDAYFNKRGHNIAMRRYDSRTTLIETFTSSIRPSEEPYYCDLPSDLTFEEGDNHPGIAGVKSVLKELYRFDSDESDLFDDNLAAQLPLAFSYISTTTSTEELSITTIEPDFLLELKRACLALSNEKLDDLPIIISGKFLENDIEEMTLNNETGDLFTLKPANNKVIGTVRNISNPSTSKVSVFESNFTEWLAHWPNSESIFLQTKPSWNTEGYLYRLLPATNRFEKILGDKLGLLAAVSPNEQHVIYTETNPISEEYQTSILNLQSRESRILPFDTIADKCAWSKDSSFLICAVPNTLLAEQEPDKWLKGISTYIDEFWIVNSDTQSSRKIYDPVAEQNQRFDAYKLQIDPRDSNYLYFMDKNTNYLWSLEIDGLDGRE